MSGNLVAVGTSAGESMGRRVTAADDMGQAPHSVQHPAAAHKQGCSLRAYGGEGSSTAVVCSSRSPETTCSAVNNTAGVMTVR